MEKVDWYKLTGDDPIKDYGSLELSIHRRTDQFKNEDLGPLKRLLVKLDVSQVNDLLETCPLESDSLVKSLGTIFRYNGHMINLIVEVYKNKSVSASSLTMTLMNSYLRAECADYLKQTLGDVVQSIQTKELLICFDSLIQSIFKNFPACPFVVRKICSQLVDLEGTSSIAEFMFTGLLCHALNNPLEFGLFEAQPCAETLQNLSIMAESLQQLASLREFPFEEVNHKPMDYGIYKLCIKFEFPEAVHDVAKSNNWQEYSGYD